MGSSGSKAARTAAASATRKYPARSPAQPPPTSAPLTTTSTSPHAAAPAIISTSTQTSEAPPNSTSTSTSAPTHTAIGSEALPPEAQVGPTVHTQAMPSATKTEAIDLDARDPAFGSRLTTLGPVKPFPSLSHSSTSDPQPAPDRSSTAALGPGLYPNPATNPAIATLTARAEYQLAVEQEKAGAGRKGFEGRQYVDVKTLRRVLVLRDEQGVSAGEIEEMLGLKRGVVRGLGRVGVVEAA